MISWLSSLEFRARTQRAGEHTPSGGRVGPPLHLSELDSLTSYYSLKPVPPLSMYRRNCFSANSQFLRVCISVVACPE